MALIKLSGLNIQLNADGSAQFAGVKILFNADGSCSFASANAAFAADGALNLPLIHLLADGSAQFANGAMTIDALGSTSLQSGNIFLDALAGGINAGGIGTNVNGRLKLKDLNDDTEFEVATAIGSAAVNIAGVQVLTNQQPAIADATGAGDVVAQSNLLLPALRVHGLIAP